VTLEGHGIAVALLGWLMCRRPRGTVSRLAAISCVASSRDQTLTSDVYSRKRGTGRGELVSSAGLKFKPTSSSVLCSRFLQLGQCYRLQLEC